MEKQVNIKLDETKLKQIDKEIEKNPLFNSRTHFVELAVIYFLDTKPQKYFGSVGDVGDDYL